MKRILCLIIAIACIWAVAYAEMSIYDEDILFRDLPWNLDAVTFWETVQEDIGSSLNSGTMADIWLTEQAVVEKKTITYFDAEQDGYIWFAGAGDLPCYEIYVSVDDDVRVGGYPVNSVTASAIPTVYEGVASSTPDKSVVVNCDYYMDIERMTDPSAACADLVSKLESLYGAVSQVESWGGQTNYLWYGANDTYAMLVHVTNDAGATNYMSINYGRTNVKELLDVVKHPESTIDNSSTDGL